jgi:hypothetical protein
MKGAAIGAEASGSRGSDPPSVDAEAALWRLLFCTFPQTAASSSDDDFTVDPDYLWCGMLLSKV